MRKEEERFQSDEFGEDILNTFSKKNLEGAEGLPVGVQVATPIYRDEQCLAVMKRIEELTQFTK